MPVRDVVASQHKKGDRIFITALQREGEIKRCADLQEVVRCAMLAGLPVPRHPLILLLNLQQSGFGLMCASESSKPQNHQA